MSNLILSSIAATLLPENTLPDWLLPLIDAACIVLIALLVIWAAQIALRIARNVQQKGSKAGDTRKIDTVGSVIMGVVRCVVWFVAITAVIGALGLEDAMASILAVAGIGGLLLTVGAQSLVKDVVTGIFMLFEDQVEVGDFVTAGSVTGTVTAITLRTLTIRGPRGEMNVVPNGNVSVLTNFSRNDYTAIIDVGIAYEADVNRALALMLEEGEAYVESSGGDAFNPAIAGVVELSDSSVKLRMTIGVKNLTHLAVQNELNKRIKERFAAEGIEIPYNKLVVLSADAR
ncbi:MAG: mechanosensitive ion channel [Clostridia bacterium]|nr:mechanosensitive ion channel [Clostridia bacterium]